MIFTVFAIFLPLAGALKGLRHWLYALHVLLVAGVSWVMLPSLHYPLWHASYAAHIMLWHIVSITLVTFTAYGWDKRQAKTGGWRVPERTLHALTFIGGTLGAIAGSKFFRHKTIKGEFRQMFVAVIIMQVIAIGAAIWISNF